MALAEDLAAFFATTQGFAQSASTGWGATIAVILDAAHLEQLGVSSVDPRALARASDVGADRVGQTITIAGATYTIRDRKPLDDGALVELELEAA